MTPIAVQLGNVPLSIVLEWPFRLENSPAFSSKPQKRQLSCAPWGQRSAKMAANFLAPLSVVFLAVLLSQKIYYTPRLTRGINGYGLNPTLINSEPTPTGLEAFYSHNRSARALSTWSYSTVTKKCLLTVLLLGGDIHLNPGPNWKYPCGTCNKLVKRNQKGIQCDHCDLWYHTKCCSIGDEIYNILANSPCVWLCPSCGLPSFSDSLPEASLDTHNSFSLL